MADERKCFAGDLSSDALGKSVRVTYKIGNITSTVEDVLREVRHTAEFSAYLTAAEIVDGPKRTTELFFLNTNWSTGSLGFYREVGLTVGDTVEVTVLP